MSREWPGFIVLCLHVRRREALRTWQSKQGIGATYGNLLELFVQAGHTQCAEVLCEVLRRKYPLKPYLLP